MKAFTCSACVLIVAVLSLPAAAQMTREEAMQLAQKYRGQMGTVQTEVPEPIALTEADVDEFITVVTKLRELGLETELDGAKTDAGRMARALSANQEAYGVLKSNYFTTERFQSVMFSVALAIGTIEGDLDPDKLDQARAAQAKAIEQMKGRLTAEQLDAVTAGMGAAGSYMDRLANQPAGNVELIRARLAELKRAIGADTR